MASGAKAFGNVFTSKKKARASLPDARGTFAIEDVDQFISDLKKAPRDERNRVNMEFAAWKKSGPKAGEYLSGNLSIMLEGDAERGPNPHRQQAREEKKKYDDFDEPLPF